MQNSNAAKCRKRWLPDEWTIGKFLPNNEKSALEWRLTLSPLSVDLSTLDIKQFAYTDSHILLTGPWK